MARTSTTNGKSFDSDYEALQKQIAALKGDLAGLTNVLGDLGRHQGEAVATQARGRAEALMSEGSAKIEALRGSGGEHIQEAINQISAQIEVLRGQAAEAAAKADGFVKERPATAVGIAAGVGFLVGLLSSRRT